MQKISKKKNQNFNQFCIDCWDLCLRNGLDLHIIEENDAFDLDRDYKNAKEIRSEFGKNEIVILKRIFFDNFSIVEGIDAIAQYHSTSFHQMRMQFNIDII